MMNIADIASWVLLSVGALFYLIGALGLMRMPDFFTRMHAISVAETMGAGLMLAGLIIQAGFTLVTMKLLIIAALFFFTNPVITHALAQAALHDGMNPILDEDRTSGDALQLFDNGGPSSKR